MQERRIRNPSSSKKLGPLLGLDYEEIPVRPQ
jgi:hypothetical protein